MLFEYQDNNNETRAISHQEIINNFVNSRFFSFYQFNKSTDLRAVLQFFFKEVYKTNLTLDNLSELTNTIKYRIS